jgi:hypothetical protein
MGRTSQPQPAGNPPVIYPAQGVLTLISRAWNLTRSNLKVGILTLLPPTLLITGIQMLSSMLASRTVLTPTSLQALAGQLMLAGLSLLLLIPYFYLWIFSSCALSRYYFSAIVGEPPLRLRDCWAFVGKHWLAYLGLATGLGVASTVVAVLNLIILALGIGLASLLITTLATNLLHIGNALMPSIMLILFLLFWGFVILSLFLSLATLQTFFLLFPLVAVSTAPTGKEDWWPLIRNAYRLLFGNFPRLLIFALGLFFMMCAMTGVLMMVPSLWAVVEKTRTGLSYADRLPMHVQVVFNLCSSLASLIVNPFLISAVTLLWYDCLVRREGLDLRLWFNQLARRHSHPPEEYNTQVEPQPV